MSLGGTNRLDFSVSTTDTLFQRAYFSFEFAGESCAAREASGLQERSSRRPFWKLFQLMLHKGDAQIWCKEEMVLYMYIHK